MRRGLPFWLRVALGLVRRLVPGRHRMRWRREWEAELASELADGGIEDEGIRAGASLLFGILRDAWAMHELDGPKGRGETTMKRMMRTFVQAARGLARSPSFTALAVVTLGLGIGASSAMFAVVDHVLLRPLPYPDPDRVVELSHPVPGMPAAGRWGLSVAGYFHFSQQARSFQAIGAYYGTGVTLTGGDRSTRVPGALVSATLFRVLGARAEKGRLILADDDVPDAPPVAVISHALWQDRFGGDPALVGREIEMDGRPVRVVGIAPPGLGIGDLSVDVWLAWQLDPSARPVNSHYVATLARLVDGVSVDDARREMVDLTARLPERFPQVYSESFMRDFGFTADVRKLSDVMLGDSRRPLWLLLGAVGVLFLLAWANVANLFLVRTEGRAREVAVHRAMGASSGELARYFMAEGLAVTTLAALGGLLLARVAIGAFHALAPDTLPRASSVALDARTAVFAAVTAVVAGLVLGLFPLFRHGRTAPASALGEGARGNAEREGGLLRGSLVAGQMALAVILLASAGLMLRTVSELRKVNPGFDPHGAVAVDLYVPGWTYPRQADIYAFHRDLLASIRQLPGVEAAGVTGDLPMSGESQCYAVALEDGLPSEGEPPSCPPVHFVSDGYIEAMGIPVEEGRVFEAGDDAQRTGAAVVSRKLADAYWPDGGLGRGIRIYGAEPPFHHVIGIVGDVKEKGLTEDAPAAAYFPLLSIEGQSQWGPIRYATLVVRAPSRDDAGLLDAVRTAIARQDADVPIAQMRTLESVVARSMARTTFTMVLMVLAAGLALVLGAVGLYGVVAYTVSRRRTEIGIRMALGAAASGVASMVLLRSLRLTAVGAVVGVVGALLTGQLLRALLFRVGAVDLPTLAAVVVLLIGVGALASFLPARRAAHTDPAVSLRAD